MGWRLWRDRTHYDVLHVYQLTLLTLPAALACLLTHRPLLVAVRNAGLDEGTTRQGRPSLIAGPLDATAPWLQVHERIPLGGDLSDLERWGRPVVSFTHFLLQRTQAVAIVLSSRMQGYLRAHHFTLPRTYLIPNGVDIARFQPTSTSPTHERAHTVICVSRLCYQKGLDVLLQAWNLVLQRCPEARLLIVGIGPTQQQLQRMAQALDISQRVEFVGVQHDIPAQLRRGGIAVLPSRLEGMPNALLEAMACGLPCVATRVSGSEDILQHGVNGLLVEPEDYQELAEALLTFLTNPRLAQQYGQAARRRIESQYSLERITDTYIVLYKSLVARY